LGIILSNLKQQQQQQHIVLM